METYMHEVVSTLVNVVSNSNPLLGVLVSGGVIVLESLIPVLPLAAFIALNQITFGFVLGFIISYVFHVIGCYLSFTIVRHGVRDFVIKRVKNKDQLERLRKRLADIPFFSLVVIMALPFTPSFLVNIAAGLSNITKKKFFSALVVGKLFIIYFWGTIGSSLFESLTSPVLLLRIGVMILGAYVISSIVGRVFSIR